MLNHLPAVLDSQLETRNCALDHRMRYQKMHEYAYDDSDEYAYDDSDDSDDSEDLIVHHD